MLKLLYKWILLIIVALFVSFPLAFIPLKILEGTIEDEDAFLASINDGVLVVYLFYVVLIFVGILLTFVTSLLIRSVLSGEKIVSS